MDRKPYVIIGEAPESDSEEEINVPNVARTATSANSQGTIIEGEAPESDEEHEDDGGSVSSAASVTSMPSLASAMRKEMSSKRSKNNDTVKYNTLLHRRLRERNISLHRNIYDFVYQTVGNASRELNTVNQQLLRSQVQLQESASSLHVLHSQLIQLQNRLTNITSTAFLPRINT